MLGEILEDVQELGGVSRKTAVFQDLEDICGLYGGD